MKRSNAGGIQYEGYTMTYHFSGERLPPPDPSTYDASAWTPPDRRRYDVHMQNDGLWWLEANGSRVQSGNDSSPSRENARKIVLDWRNKS